EVPLEGHFPSYHDGDDWYQRVTTYDEVVPGREELSEAMTPSQLLVRPCYVAPLNHDDIEQFVTRWYAAREPEPQRRREGINSLNAPFAQISRLKLLAANPSFWPIRALLHRVTANLPSGRVKLYDKIVEAYLETIQTYRKLGQFPASLDQMKRWLA